MFLILIYIAGVCLIPYGLIVGNLLFTLAGIGCLVLIKLLIRGV